LGCELLRKRFILETLPPRGSNYEKYVDFCLGAVDNGAQVIAVTDLPMGSSRVSPIAPAHILVEKGVEVLMHFSRTTRNALRIEGDLIAAHMLGIKNLLILSGDDPRVGTYPFASYIEDFSIYDVFKLTELMNRNNENLAGVRLYGKFDFCCGGVFSPYEKDIAGTVNRMRGKFDNGCAFFISQPVFLPEVMETFFTKAQELDEEMFSKAKIYVALMIFETVSQMEYFSKVPGVYVPREYFRPRKDEDLKRYSLNKALHVVESLRAYVHGFYLTATVRDFEIIRLMAEAIL